MSKKSKTPPLPMQPVILDKDRCPRFLENSIVQYLLEHGGISLNRIALLEFTDAEREQFAQLIGYSISGYGELSYVSDASYNRAAEAAEKLGGGS